MGSTHGCSFLRPDFLIIEMGEEDSSPVRPQRFRPQGALIHPRRTLTLPGAPAGNAAPSQRPPTPRQQKERAHPPCPCAMGPPLLPARRAETPHHRMTLRGSAYAGRSVGPWPYRCWSVGPALRWCAGVGARPIPTPPATAPARSKAAGKQIGVGGSTTQIAHVSRHYSDLRNLPAWRYP